MIQMYELSKDSCKSAFNNNQGDQTDYEIARGIRIFIIAISAVALFVNIVLIIRRKQYVFNTIKLLMFVEIFYFFSLISVTPHGPPFNLDIYTKNGNDFHCLTECLIIEGRQFWLAFEGFVNLVAYTISYWFAVLITLYIKLVLENTYKQFMKKKGVLIFAVIALIIVWYLVPFILTFFSNVYFSFGPAGYKFNEIQYFFYAGIVNRYEGTGTIDEKIGYVFVIFWMLLMPITLFIYHCRLLWHNRSQVQKLQELNELNPRQFFIIKSGNLSFIIFTVQIFNVSKLLLSLFTETQWIVIFILNIIYDLLALMLIGYYFVYYYKQGRNLQERSEIENKSLVQTFAQTQNSII